MSEQQRPARIWVEDDYTEHSAKYWSLEPYSSTVSYIRADIAERMAVALEGLHELCTLKGVNKHWDVMRAARSALSAFRSATQDTEARHE